MNIQALFFFLRGGGVKIEPLVCFKENRNDKVKTLLKNIMR